ncbi:hypothetical protein JCM9279_006707 [Rhodotorula babjevae]
MPAARRKSRASVVEPVQLDSDSSSDLDSEDEAPTTRAARSRKPAPLAGNKALSKKRPRDATDSELDDSLVNTSSSSDESSGDEYGKRRKQPKKKNKTAARATAARNGVDRFSTIGDDPLTDPDDAHVDPQICRHVDWKDLCELRVVNKALHRFLTDDSTGAVVWKRALADAYKPIPVRKLKAGLMKPWQLALMHYRERCVVCLKTQYIPDERILRRLCRTCRKKTLVRLDRLRKPFPDLHPMTKHCVLRSKYRAGRLTRECITESAYIPDLLAVDTRLWSLQQADDADPKLNKAIGVPAKRARKAKNVEAAPLDPAEPVESGRVAEYVARRKKLLKRVEHDARILMSLRNR